MPQLVKMTGATSSFSILSFVFPFSEENSNLHSYNMCSVFKRKVLIFHLLLQDSKRKSAFLTSI